MAVPVVEPVIVAPAAPAPAPPEEWTYDLELVLGQIEEELQDLPEAEREKALESARVGLEAAVVITEGVQGLVGFLATRVDEESADGAEDFELETTDLVIEDRAKPNNGHRRELRELAREHARAAAEARVDSRGTRVVADSDRLRAERELST